MRKSKDSSITNILKLIAPGTPIRDGLENILRAKTGALLLITDNNDIIKKVVDMAKKGIIPEEKINKSVSRILKIKEKYKVTDKIINKGCNIEEINKEIEKLNSNIK